MSQQAYKAVFMRGGSSKGVFFHRDDLPPAPAIRDDLFLRVLGSPDPYGRQLDGLGGGISSLSKAVMIAPSDHPQADVDYTFAQIAVSEPVVDFGSTCGNLSSAVGPFSVDEGLLDVADGECLVRIFNTNTDILIHARFEVAGGKAMVEGDYAIAGVAGTGARISLDFLEPAASFCDALLPTGNVIDEFDIPGIGVVEATLIDVANPAVFVDADAFGIEATESPAELDAMNELMDRLEYLRREAAVRMGLARSTNEAGGASPRIALLSAPKAFRALDGRDISPAQMHINVRMLSMANVHRAVPLTGAMSIAAASRIEGTVAARYAQGDADVLIGQPSGVIDVNADVTRSGEGWEVASTRVYRTARRLMEGNVLVPPGRIQ